MTEPILKEMTTPLSRELAEYVLLLKDLQTAYNAFSLWFDRYSGRKDSLSPEDILISQSLFRDSLVMFIECFNGSAPVSLPVSEIYESANNGMNYFQWLKDMRDSYAAHKFGSFRQCVAGVMVDADGEVIGSGHTSRIYAGMTPVGKDDLLSFIRRALVFLNKKVMALGEQLYEEGAKMSPAEIAGLKTAETYDVDAAQVRTARERFRKLFDKGDKK